LRVASIYLVDKCANVYNSFLKFNICNQKLYIPIIKKYQVLRNGCICHQCFKSEICVCNICKCQHQPVGSEHVCPGNKYLFLARKSGKGAISVSSANREHIRLETRVLRFGEGGSFSDELKDLHEQVAQLIQENEELRRIKAVVDAKQQALICRR